MSTTDPNERNFTGITPRAGQTLAETVRTVRQLRTDLRAKPNPFRAGGGASLPQGTGQYKVLMLLDALNPGTPGWDYPRFH